VPSKPIWHKHVPAEHVPRALQILPATIGQGDTLGAEDGDDDGVRVGVPVADEPMLRVTDGDTEMELESEIVGDEDGVIDGVRDNVAGLGELEGVSEIVGVTLGVTLLVSDTVGVADMVRLPRTTDVWPHSFVIVIESPLIAVVGKRQEKRRKSVAFMYSTSSHWPWYSFDGDQNVTFIAFWAQWLPKFQPSITIR
jgi:hypothetical protein